MKGPLQPLYHLLVLYKRQRCHKQNTNKGVLRVDLCKNSDPMFAQNLKNDD